MNKLLNILFILLILLVTSCDKTQEKVFFPLNPYDLHEPEKVSLWLKENGQYADRLLADKYYRIGNEKASKKQWSDAIKYFVKSAIIYPEPRALLARVDSEIRMMSGIRKNKINKRNSVKSDMQHFLTSYKTAQAADDVLKTLTPAQRETLESIIACVSLFVENGVKNKNCLPMKLYGSF